MVPVDRAEELGKAIIAAARGEQYGQVPGWWYDFDKQYQAEEWRRKPEDDIDDDHRSDPYAKAAGVGLSALAYRALLGYPGYRRSRNGSLRGVPCRADSRRVPHPRTGVKPADSLAAPMPKWYADFERQ